MIILTVGAELFHVDGRTDMTEIILTSRNFSGTPKKLWWVCSLLFDYRERRKFLI